MSGHPFVTIIAPGPITGEPNMLRRGLGQNDLLLQCRWGLSCDRGAHNRRRGLHVSAVCRVPLIRHDHRIGNDAGTGTCRCRRHSTVGGCGRRRCRNHVRLRFSGATGEKTKYTTTSNGWNKSPCHVRGGHRRQKSKDIFFHRPKPTPAPAQTLWGVLGRSVGAKRPTPP